MDIATLFWTAVAVTVVFLAVALVSGLRGGRRLHLLFGPLALASLTVAILLTERLAAQFEFVPAEKDVHLVIAKSAGIAALTVLVTGLLLWRRPAFRRLHRWCVFGFLLLTVAATVSGTWMWLHATPR